MQTGTIPFRPSEKIVLLQPINSLMLRWFWWKWLIAIGFLSFFFAISMDIAPHLHSDEVMIIDLGRIILNPHTEWSIAWITKLDHPALLWSYVGTVLQEIIFEAAGQYGPRVFALAGAIAAATAMVGWLRARGVLQNKAFILGLIFFLDPLFVQSYTMGRVDGWAMGLCLASCWTLSDTSRKLDYNKLFRWRIVLAGALATTAFFTWPSAVFLFPLILLELINSINKYRDNNKNLKNFTTPFFFFGLGSFVMGLLLLLPIFPLLAAQFTNITEGLKTNTRTGSEGVKASMYFHIFNQFIELLRVIKFSPVLLLLAVICMVMKREIGLIVAVLAAILLMIFTIVYIHRVQYLLPYFIVSIAGIYSKEYKRKDIYLNNFFRMGGLAFLLIWCIGLSLFIRLVLAGDDRAYRNRALVYKAAQSMIGKGRYKVLIIPYEFYYPGRSLNWQMYKPYLAQNERLSSEEVHRILPHVDYVITNRASEESAEFVQQLKKEGMRNKGDYNVYDVPVEEFNGITTNVTRLRNLYSIFHQPYGPYRLYKRDYNHATIASQSQ